MELKTLSKERINKINMRTVERYKKEQEAEQKRFAPVHRYEPDEWERQSSLFALCFVVGFILVILGIIASKL